MIFSTSVVKMVHRDDPVEKYLPDIKYPSYGWSEYLKGEKDGNNIRPHITLRQLASHMSGKHVLTLTLVVYPVPRAHDSLGIGRDYPPYELRDWPQDSLKPLLEGIRAKSSADIPFPKRDYAHLVESVNKYPLINLPYDYPIYSNTGMDLLGLANVAANNHSQAHPEIEPHTHEDLIKRDIFGPLKLNSSFYRVPYETAQADLAVPNKNHEWAVSASSLGSLPAACSLNHKG
jgi:CubicO group peptidase (beta-lactamase class C family)